MNPQRVYSDDERSEVLAFLDLGHSQPEAAASFDMPLSTVNLWAVSRRQAAGNMESERTMRVDWASTHITASKLAGKLATQQLERYLDRDLTPSQLRDAMIVGGIATDKALDLLDGRKGETPRGGDQHLHLHVSQEQARALLEAATREPNALP